MSRAPSVNDRFPPRDEFKPDTPTAIAKGKEQLVRYVPAVRDYDQKRIKDKAGDDSSYQGKITSLVEAQCLKGGSLVFESDVITYPLCEKKFECTR
jgi:hypothetical protein